MDYIVPRFSKTSHTNASDFLERCKKNDFDGFELEEPYTVTIKEDGSQVQACFVFNNDKLRLTELRTKSRYPIVHISPDGVDYTAFITSGATFQSNSLVEIMNKPYWDNVLTLMNILDSTAIWIYSELIPRHKTPCGITYPSDMQGTLNLFEVSYYVGGSNRRLFVTPANLDILSNFKHVPIVMSGDIFTVSIFEECVDFLFAKKKNECEGLMLNIKGCITKIKLHHANCLAVKATTHHMIINKMISYYNVKLDELGVALKESIPPRKSREKSLPLTISKELIDTEIEKQLSYMTRDALPRGDSVADFIQVQKSLRNIIREIKSRLVGESNIILNKQTLAYISTTLTERVILLG